MVSSTGTPIVGSKKKSAESTEDGDKSLETRGETESGEKHSNDSASKQLGSIKFPKVLKEYKFREEVWQQMHKERLGDENLKYLKTYIKVMSSEYGRLKVRTKAQAAQIHNLKAQLSNQLPLKETSLTETEQVSVPTVEEPAAPLVVRQLMVTAPSKPVQLTVHFTLADMLREIEYLKFCQFHNIDDQRDLSFDVNARNMIRQKLFNERDRLNLAIDDSVDNWFRWSGVVLAERLRIAYEEEVKQLPSTTQASDIFEKLKPALVVRDSKTVCAYTDSIYGGVANCTSLGMPVVADDPSTGALADVLIAGLSKCTSTQANRKLSKMFKELKTAANAPQASSAQKQAWDKPRVSLRAYCDWVSEEIRKARDICLIADEWDEKRDSGNGKSGDSSIAAVGDKRKGPRFGSDANTDHKKSRREQDDSHKKFPCNGCGNLAVKQWDECLHCTGHPDRNAQGKWEDSKAYKEIKARIDPDGSKSRKIYLLEKKRADGTPLTDKELAAKQKAHDALESRIKQARDRKGEDDVFSHINNPGDALIECFLSTDNINRLSVQVLVDSGAVTANYVSEDVARWIEDQAVRSTPMCHVSTLERDKLSVVNLGGTASSCNTLGTCSCNFIFLNEANNECESLPCLKFKKLDSNIDCIIGLPTIRKYRLAEKLSSVFVGQGGDIYPNCQVALNDEAEKPQICSCREPSSSTHRPHAMCSPCREGGLSNSEPSKLPRSRPNIKETHQLCLLADIKSSEELLGSRVADDDEIIWKDNPFDRDPDEISASPSGNLIDKIHLLGTPVLREKLRSLCNEFEDIFSETVKSDPADVPPMEIKVDLDKWQTGRSRGPPRPQSFERQEAIAKQVDLYKKLGVIEPSLATEYSQVHLVPKPKKGEWRFCLDFVRLNEATQGTESWPIPNIPALLQRVGNKRPKVFGVMDMTSGYHQAPLSAASRMLTAFICFLGVFHWLRVPMGLKNAAAYFQRVMATVVLAGLIFILCELYIDDVLVFGQSDDEFVNNLREVFKRFRKYRVTLNPSKCNFGMDRVEYVGHVISAEGLTFSKEKRAKVLNFPLPQRPKELQGFLGLINYFRAHLPDMTSKERKLRAMIKGKGSTLHWTPELESVFYELREEVSSCPMLFFVDPNAPIIVMTDASDYGIGVYIYQIINGKERPIIFISKALLNEQLRWATIEKEAYAIFFVLKAYEYLLRDNKFLLRTDHKNLTYLNLNPSPKVQRWKLFIQEFNFDIEHVAGKDNFVADAFSRLCTVWEEPMIDEDYLFAFPTERNVQSMIHPRIPQEYYDFIREVHNEVCGHHGVERTLSKLQVKGRQWDKMRAHVKQFIRECPACQLMSEKKILIKVHPRTMASYEPMDVLNVDTIGPLPEDEFGYKFILVVIDCFSRWVELYPTIDTSAMEAADALLEHVSRFGVPTKIRTDQGPQFANSMIAELAKLLRMEHELTTAYSSEENGIVERANKEVMRFLRGIILHDRIYSKWSRKQIPLVRRILNTQEHTRTGVTPAELLFGDAVDLDRAILCPLNGPRTVKLVHEHLDTMLMKQRELIEIASKLQNEFDEHHIATHDTNGITEYPVNSYVLLDREGGKRNKFSTQLRGPYQVVNIVGSTYSLQDLITGKNFDTHVTTLKPFNYDPTRVDPKQVVMQEKGEFLIDRIIDHRGDRYRQSTMEFLVRWSGYGTEGDSWEPYKSLRNTDQLIEYLAANKMRSLIPKEHK